MSEPLGVEERARLRERAELSVAYPKDRTTFGMFREACYPKGILALLDEVDRLTEALRTTTNASMLFESVAAEEQDRAERAEADLADEKRRHVECDEAKERYHEQWMLTEADLADEKRRRAGLVALADEWEGYGHGKYCVHVDDPGCQACKIVIALRALLDTATEET